MSWWRPHISLWTSKGGGPISPTTSRGFVVLGGLGLGLAGAGAKLIWSGDWVGAALLGVGGLALKEVVGWFTATQAGRADFLSRVEAARPRPLPAPAPVSPVIAVGATVPAFAAAAATFVLVREAQVLALVASLSLGGFAALCWVDVLRTWLRARALAKASSR